MMNDRGDIEQIQKRYAELQELLAQPGIIADKSGYAKLAKEMAGLSKIVMLINEIKKITSQKDQLRKTLQEEHEPEFMELVSEELQELSRRQQDLESAFKKALSAQDQEKDLDVIMEIRAGTGGLEAALFAADLYRMYLKYANRRNWDVETMSSHPTELGGFKEIIFSVKGHGAYKRLKLESGVHRVQRIPATETQGRIHTSTATVVALVEPTEVDLVIEPKDLKIDTYRSSGPGGQHMQKSDSAVRITHVPTGIVVACQDERSQLKNKNKAIRILRAKLLDMKQQQESKRISQVRRSQIGSGDRSEKIRTYNFPDRRVTDHRIGLTIHKLEEILEGDLDRIIEPLLNKNKGNSPIFP
jgi:peptide chain release factor 1